VARAGRFGTKGLAITFVSDENDRETQWVGEDTGLSSRCGAYPMQVGI